MLNDVIGASGGISSLFTIETLIRRIIAGYEANSLLKSHGHELVEALKHLKQLTKEGTSTHRGHQDNNGLLQTSLFLETLQRCYNTISEIDKYFGDNKYRNDVKKFLVFREGTAEKIARRIFEKTRKARHFSSELRKRLSEIQLANEILREPAPEAAKQPDKDAIIIRPANDGLNPKITIKAGEFRGPLIVAFKIIESEGAPENEEHLSRFKNEIDILKTLNHRNIVHFFDASTSDDKVILITDYMQHGSIFEIIDRITPHLSSWAKEKRTMLADCAEIRKLLKQPLDETYKQLDNSQQMQKDTREEWFVQAKEEIKKTCKEILSQKQSKQQVNWQAYTKKAEQQYKAISMLLHNPLTKIDELLKKPASLAMALIPPLIRKKISRLLKKMPLYFMSPEIRLTWIQNIASALSHLHNEQKVLHRHLSSKVVLVEGIYQTAKIGGFSYARRLADAQAEKPDPTFEILKSLDTAWQAEEIRKGKAHSYQSDVYSLSIIIWEIMALENPEKITTIVEKLLALKALDFFNTPEYRKLLNTCWSDQPEDRLSADTILKEFSRDFLVTYPNKILSEDGYLGNIFTGRFGKTDVAVKTVALRDDNYNKKFLALKQEADNLQALSPKSEYMVDLLFSLINTEEPTSSLATDLMVLGDLYSLIQRKDNKGKPLIPAFSAHKKQLISDITNGVNFMHQQKWLHRNLGSPQVLVHEHLRAKISGLRLAMKLTESLATGSRTSNPNVPFMETEQDVEILSQTLPQWKAPEVKEKKAYSYPADIYSLALIIAEILLWEANEKNSKLAEKIQDNDRPTRKALSKYGKAILLCLNKTPEDRNINAILAVTENKFDLTTRLKKCTPKESSFLMFIINRSPILLIAMGLLLIAFGANYSNSENNGENLEEPASTSDNDVTTTTTTTQLFTACATIAYNLTQLREENDFFDSSIENIIDSATGHADLNDVGWAGQPLGDAAVAAIADIFDQNPGNYITNLRLSSTGLGPDGACHVARILATQNTINFLALYGNNIGADGMIAIANALSNNQDSGLTKAEFGDNNITASAGPAIYKMITRNTRLSYLGLGENWNLSSAAANIGNGLKYNQALTEIDLHSTRTDNLGANAIAASLRENTVLSKLNLNSNSINFVGLANLFSNLTENSALNTLIVSGNTLFESLGENLGRGDEVSEPLKYIRLQNLDMSWCNINDLGADVLITGLRNNPWINSTILSNNDINSIKLDELLSALEADNFAIEALDLSDNLGINSTLLARANALTARNSQYPQFIKNELSIGPCEEAVFNTDNLVVEIASDEPLTFSIDSVTGGNFANETGLITEFSQDALANNLVTFIQNCSVSVLATAFSLIAHAGNFSTLPYKGYLIALPNSTTTSTQQTPSTTTSTYTRQPPESNSNDETLGTIMIIAGILTIIAAFAVLRYQWRKDQQWKAFDRETDIETAQQDEQTSYYCSCWGRFFSVYKDTESHTSSTTPNQNFDKNQGAQPSKESLSVQSNTASANQEKTLHHHRSASYLRAIADSQPTVHKTFSI